jgi:hypothetical protein
MCFTYVPTHWDLAPWGWNGVFKSLDLTPMCFTVPQHKCMVLDHGLRPHRFRLSPHTFGLRHQELDWCPRKFGRHPHGFCAFRLSIHKSDLCPQRFGCRFQELQLCPCAFGLPRKLDGYPQNFGFCLYRFPLSPCPGARCPCGFVVHPKRFGQCIQQGPWVSPMPLRIWPGPTGVGQASLDIWFNSLDFTPVNLTYAPAHLVFPRSRTGVPRNFRFAVMGFIYAPTHWDLAYRGWNGVFRSLDLTPMCFACTPAQINTHGFHVCPYTFGLSSKEFDWGPQKIGLSPPWVSLVPLRIWPSPTEAGLASPGNAGVNTLQRL